jgi:two-component system, NtrC family, sensor kinase
MYLGVFMLLVTLLVLLAGSLHGLLKYRNLTKSIRERGEEFPVAATLGQQVSELRSALWQLSQSEAGNPNEIFQGRIQGWNDLEQNLAARTAMIRLTVQSNLQLVESTLDHYESTLTDSETIDRRIAKHDDELRLVAEFRAGLKRIRHLVDEQQAGSRAFQTTQIFSPLENQLANLQRLATKLPTFMQDRMEEFSRKARSEFQALVMVSASFGLFAFLTIAYLIGGFRNRIAQPLEKLIAGSRQVAAGNFDFRIELNSNDEVAELADALNAMTSKFQTINLDLNRQVQQRTKEVVRSEKMASVGFLAAGVAHEINNPLATIAWSAESLEMRLIDVLTAAGLSPRATESPEIAEMLKYLRRIQDEAFRCKGITAGLLDFSRMGDVKKSATRLAEVIESVIEMVRPLSKYRDRNIHFHADPQLECICNAQEMKQVALNLITNALGSVEVGGTVTVELVNAGDQAEFRVIDDGCGMTDEVMTHLFEPFFTRRRDGQGTGLGLSITYQIIQEHGGNIAAYSAGPGCGSQFIVSLPRVKHESNANAKVAA